MIILAVGKMTTKGLNETLNHYLKQLRQLEIIEIKESNMNEEGRKILRHIKSNDYVATLEIEGTPFSSVSLSNLLARKKQYASGRIVFVIGGSDGLDKRVKDRSDQALSMSHMTFPHQFARVMLVEQLYRAQKIQDGHPYHK